MSDEIDRLNEALKKLRIDYDRYFVGLERLEPLKERDVVKKELRRLMSEPTSNTARRFRLQTLQASLVTHEAHWNRIARQIEEGTYKRDKLRAQAILEQGPDDQATKTLAKEPATAENPPVKARTDYPESIHKLFETYESTRKQIGDPRTISIDALAATVQKQVSMIKEQYQCQSVEFKVAVKDGKAILRAIPK